MPLQSLLSSCVRPRGDRNFRPLISGGYPRLFPHFPRNVAALRVLPSPTNAAKVLENARRSDFCDVPPIAVPSHPPCPCQSDLCRSIRRLTKQVVTPLRERLTHACRYLLVAAVTRKRATFISPVWSQSSKSSTLVSLLSRAPPTSSQS